MAGVQQGGCKKEPGRQLSRIGEHWEKGGASDTRHVSDDLKADLEYFGAGIEALPVRFRGVDKNEFEVLAMFVPAFKLFARCATQWRVGGMGEEVGLDYNIAFAIMDRKAVDPTDQLDLLDQLRLIETGYLNSRRKRRTRERRRVGRK